MNRLEGRSTWVAASIGVLTLAVVVFLVVHSRGERETPAARPGAAGMVDAPDMPAMDMDLERGTIRLSEEHLRTFGVTFGVAERRPIERTIRAVGVVDFDETRMTYVTPKFGGFVERLHVDFTGQPISRGQPLLEIYSPELVSAQEELLLARRLAERVGGSGVEGVAAGSSDLLESAKRRLRYWDISEAQIQRLLATGEVRKTLTLHAPVSGIVMEKNVFEGQAVRAGENLYMVADLSRVWIEAELFESDAGIVHAGMPATIEVAAYPGRTFAGTVDYVYPTLDERTRSMKARIALVNPGRRLKPGMYATVRLAHAIGEAVAIPRSAVLQTGEAAVAFVDAGGGRLTPRELTIGMAGEEYVEVLGGVEAGERVVTSAQFLLDSESNLAEVMRAMMAQMGLSDMDGMEAMEGMGADTGAMRGMEMPRREP